MRGGSPALTVLWPVAAVHLASPNGVADTLIRPIGSAITREPQELVSPGYTVRIPTDLPDARNWLEALSWLEILPNTTNTTLLQRLSDMADLNETQAVFRFHIRHV